MFRKIFSSIKHILTNCNIGSASGSEPPTQVHIFIIVVKGVIDIIIMWLGVILLDIPDFNKNAWLQGDVGV